MAEDYSSLERGRNNHVKPDGMPDDCWADVLNGKRCGARTRAGGWCRAKPYLTKGLQVGPGPFRCKYHGGPAALKAAGVPGNRGNRTHGIYAKGMTDDERALADEGLFDVGTVDPEIEVVKVRLARALKLELEQEAALAADPDSDHGVVMQRRRVKTAGGVTEREVERARTDYRAIVDRLVAQLCKLVAAKAQLEGGDEGARAEAAAAKLRDFVRDARNGGASGALAFPLGALGVRNAGSN